MSDNSLNNEVPNTEAAAPAPDQTVTAAAGAVESTPEEQTTQVSEGGQAAPPPKTFTQEEVDAIAARARAQGRRSVERELTQRVPESPYANIPADQLTPDQKVEVVAHQKAQQLVQAQEFERRRTDFRDRADEKYPDFAQVFHDGLTVTPTMAEALLTSDVGHDVAYHLGTHPEEAARIARLAPAAQAREIGKLEAKLTSAPAKPVSQAPAPLTPVTSRASLPVVDTTDPRSDSMSAEEWIAHEDRRVMARLKAGLG